MKYRRTRLLAVVILLVALTGMAIPLLRGRGLGLWRVAALVRAVVDHYAIVSSNDGQFTNVIFLHHSVGRNLVEQGEVRTLLTQAGYRFYDHDYNWEGLRRPNGTRAGYSYVVPDDNTDPDGLAALFAQPAYGLPINAFSGLLQHETLVFKSCYPASNITSDRQLATYKSHYLQMRDVIDRHTDRLFIVLSPPPLHPSDTDAGAAARARAFAEWLKSPEYLDGHPNMVTFDLFDSLAENDPTAADYSMLRADFRVDGDSHPNQRGNQRVGPLLANFIIQAAEAYSAGD